MRNQETIYTTEHGETLEHEGKTLWLQQQAYHSNTAGDPYYTAIAADAEGNEYKVRWEITCPDADEESDACNWAEYEVTPY